MSRYPYEKIVGDGEARVKIDDKTVKTIYNNVQNEALIEILPAASTNIAEATELKDNQWHRLSKGK